MKKSLPKTPDFLKKCERPFLVSDSGSKKGPLFKKVGEKKVNYLNLLKKALAWKVLR